MHHMCIISTTLSVSHSGPTGLGEALTHFLSMEAVSSIAAFFVDVWRDDAPRSAGHGIVAPRLASGKGHNKSIRVPAGYPGLHAITDTPRPLTGSLQIRDVLYPKASLGSMFHSPALRGKHPAIQSHLFNIYIPPIRIDARAGMSGRASVPCVWPRGHFLRVLLLRFEA